tara:strand:+ start:1690 stop:2271 length:582 start_codon:yes stop_codon:yes gene_type:complete
MKIIIPLFLFSFLFGEFNVIYNGFGIDLGSNGSGFFITRQYNHNSDLYALNAELRFYDIKSENETIIINGYTGQYQTVGGKSLFMVPLFFGANYYPFAGEIENNFSPFITGRCGINLSVDGKEKGSFKERWSRPETQISPGGFIGVGIDFKMATRTTASIMVGLELLKLNTQFDGMLDYSGGLIHISFNHRKQ